MRPRTDRTPLACLILMVAAIGMSRAEIIDNGWHTRQPRDKKTVEPDGSWWDVACWIAPWPFCPPPIKDPPMPTPKELTPDVPECGTFEGPCQ
jgi:hypothetical protein